MLLPLGLWRAWQGAAALVHVDLGEKRRQSLMVRHDGLDHAVVAQGHRGHRTEMSADFAHQTEAGIDGNVQITFSGDNRHRLPGADFGADVALEAPLLV